MRAIAIIGLLLGGCTLVYDSQYDDRAGELEEFRSEIFPAEQGVKLVATGEERLYWVDFVRPGDQNVLHSMVPPDFSATTYSWSEGDGDSTILDYHFGKQIVVRCTFGTALAFSATSTNAEIGRTSNGDSQCAVDGNTVYFLVANRIDRWVPNGTPPSPEPDLQVVIDFELSTEIVGGVDGFGVIGDLAIVTEGGGDIYAVNLSTGNITWLENETQVIGSVFFDDRGVMFDTNGDGPHYIEYATRQERPFRDMVADGGYHLSFKHGEIHVPADDADFNIHQRHVIYRGQRGIFAYGLDTGNVIDLLLDRGEGFEAEILYKNPVVSGNGFLYVKGEPGDSFGGDAPIYQVDLNGRLR